MAQGILEHPEATIRTERQTARGEADVAANDRSSAAAWQEGSGFTPTLRVCERCEARQRGFGAEPEIAFLADGLRRRAQADTAASPLRILETGCMKVCPQDGVAVSAGRHVPEGTIIRNAEEADALFQLCRTKTAGRQPSWAESFIPRRRALRRAQRLQREP